MSREVEIVAKHHWDLLTDVYGPLTKIGDGCQGIVYAMEDRPGHILKMAHTPGDAFIASYTLRWPARFCSQVPEFKEVATLKGYFLTVREDLRDAKFSRNGPAGMEELLNAAYDDEDVPNRHMDPWELDNLLQEVTEDFLRRYDLVGTRIQQTLLADVRELLVWARENGIYIGDAHRDNWGMREGVYVLRDWGCCAPDRYHPDNKDAEDALDAIFKVAKLDP